MSSHVFCGRVAIGYGDGGIVNGVILRVRRIVDTERWPRQIVVGFAIWNMQLNMENTRAKPISCHFRRRKLTCSVDNEHGLNEAYFKRYIFQCRWQNTVNKPYNKSLLARWETTVSHSNWKVFRYCKFDLPESKVDGPLEYSERLRDSS